MYVDKLIMSSRKEVTCGIFTVYHEKALYNYLLNIYLITYLPGIDLSPVSSTASPKRTNRKIDDDMVGQAETKETWISCKIARYNNNHTINQLKLKVKTFSQCQAR